VIWPRGIASVIWNPVLRRLHDEGILAHRHDPPVCVVVPSGAAPMTDAIPDRDRSEGALRRRAAGTDVANAASTMSFAATRRRERALATAVNCATGLRIGSPGDEGEANVRTRLRWGYTSWYVEIT
jgi:hypothetical protein